MSFIEKVEVVTKGPQGIQGPAGEGVPVGGTTGQVLSKVDGTDYNTEWVDQSGGGGTTNLSVGTTTATTLDINSDTGTDATIPAAVANTAAGLMTGTDKAKLDGVETGATADQTGAEIKAAYEAEANTNAFTDAEQSKLAGIAASANNYSHPNHTGDVTSTGDGATVIANNAVTFAKMQDIATQTFLGRTTAATGDPEALTAAQARAILNVEDGATADQTGAEIVAAIDTQLGGSGWQSGGGGTSWTITEVQTGALASGDMWLADSSVARTRDLPLTPSTGDEVIVKDDTGNASVNNITIGRNGSTIVGVAEDLIISVDYDRVWLKYNGTTWKVVD